jgi:hypothetical protein
MTQPIKPFKLHAPNLSEDSRVDPSDGLPSEVAGQPASYFWKDVIHSGNYVHPNRNFSLAVDHDRLNRWAETGQQMLAAGVAIPINCDHSDAARDVVGYIKEFKLDGDRLLALCQFIGEEAALMAARNLVSVGVDPDFTDGQARQWGEAVVHLALTPVPVVPDQDQFVLAEEAETNDAPAEITQLPCTPEQFQKLSELLGESVDPANCVSRVIDQLSPEEESESPDLQAELAAARQEIFQLSAKLPATIPREVQNAIAETATAKFDAAVEKGSLSPGARDRLVAVLIGDGESNVIALSRGAGAGGDRSLAMTIAEILGDSQPVSLGETTGLQAMPRQVPGEESSPIDQLRQYMTKIASVSG